MSTSVSNISAPVREITVAHSPDSDDAFMFYALATNKIRTPGLKFTHTLCDIETLNRMALEGDGAYDVSAISFHAYPYVQQKYALLSCGGSVGEGYGPMIVAPRALTLDEVKTNLAGSGYPVGKISFIKGKVEDTLPEPAIGSIALLRLDTDWYESTRHELETLYDNLVPGGILIIDDYGHWSGSRKAVDEFIAQRKLNLFLHRIDYTGRMAFKI